MIEYQRTGFSVIRFLLRNSLRMAGGGSAAGHDLPVTCAPRRNIDMSNVGFAKTVIQAELNQAAKDAILVQVRIRVLKQALSRIERLEKAMSSDAPETGQERVEEAVPSSLRTVRLPYTHNDFWLRFISRSPRSTAEIVELAIKALDFSGSDEQRRILSRRLRYALDRLVARNMVQESGSGRQRRFALGEEARSDVHPATAPALR